MSDTRQVIRRATKLEQRSYSMPETILLLLDEACESLGESRFMQPWIRAKIKEALLAGEKFDKKGPAGQEDLAPELWPVLATYALATAEESLMAVSEGVESPTQTASAGAKTPAKAKLRAGDDEFEISWPADEREGAEKFLQVSKQGQKILTALTQALKINPGDSRRVNARVIQEVLENAREATGLDEGAGLGRFKAHLKYTYEALGFVKRAAVDEV